MSCLYDPCRSYKHFSIPGCPVRIHHYLFVSSYVIQYAQGSAGTGRKPGLNHTGRVSLTELSVQEEESLVRRAKEGDKLAFSQLYETHFDRIYRYVAVKTGDRIEAEDMTQQVFLKAYQSLGGFSLKGPPVSSWFFRIAHNLIVDHLRKKTKREEHQVTSFDETTTAGGDDPEAAAEISLDMETLSAASRRLTAAQQEVVSLRFAGDLPIAEVARIMGKSEGAIKALQHSAIASLRKAMQVGNNDTVRKI